MGDTEGMDFEQKSKMVMKPMGSSILLTRLGKQDHLAETAGNYIVPHNKYIYAAFSAVLSYAKFNAE